MGGVWEGLGRLLGALGGFWAALWAFGNHLFLSVDPRSAPRGLLDRFWLHFGRVWGGVWEGLGAFGQGFGSIWELLGKYWEGFWDLERAGADSRNL